MDLRGTRNLRNFVNYFYSELYRIKMSRKCGWDGRKQHTNRETLQGNLFESPLDKSKTKLKVAIE